MEYENERIKVTNTAIIIDNYNLGDSPELERQFSIWDPIRHKLERKYMYYDKDKHRVYLPAGIDLWFVRKCLNERFYTRYTNTPYQTYSGVGIKFKPRDDKQEEALRFMCGVAEYGENEYKSQLLVSLGTGKGKTYCSIATMVFYQIKSIVITKSDSLLTQWALEITKYTNINPKEIVRINGSDQCNMILNGGSSKAKNGKIFLCTHATLHSFAERYGWERINDLFIALGIGLKFYDEAHTNADNMLMIDYFTNTYKTYYVTATPARSNYREDKIFQISLKNVPMIDLFDENGDPHTAYIAIKWNSRPSANQLSYCYHRTYGFSIIKYIDYITRKPEFYNMLTIIMEMVNKTVSKGGRVLMYIGTNDGILRVYHWLLTNYPQYIGDIGIFTSLLDKQAKQIERRKKILLTTTKSAGLGEHIEGLKMTILLAEPFKSAVLAQQTLGRTRDSNTFYIELVDMGFRYINNFYRAKIPVFNKYACDVSDMNIDSYEMARRIDNINNSKINTLAINPIKYVDTRFDIDSVIPDWMKKKEEKIKHPITFITKNNTSNYYDNNSSGPKYYG